MQTHSSNYIQPSGFARVAKTITTDAAGAATETVGPLTGFLDWMKLDIGTFTSGAVDVTITVEGTGQTIYAGTNLSANVVTRPRVLDQNDTSAANLTAVYSKIALVNDYINVVVAQGGDTKVGTLTAIVTPA